MLKAPSCAIRAQRCRGCSTSRTCIPMLCAHSSCLLWTMISNFQLQSQHVPLSAPKLGHPVLCTAQLQKPSLVAQVFHHFRSPFFFLLPFWPPPLPTCVGTQLSATPPRHVPGQGRQKRHLLAKVWQKGLSWLGWGPEGRRVSDRMLGAFLPMRTCWHCRRLPRKAVQALSLEAFKSCLDEVLSSPVWSHSWPSFELEVGLETSRHPFQPKFFYDPLKGVSSAVWFMWASVSIVTSELWSQDKEGICFFQVLPLMCFVKARLGCPRHLCTTKSTLGSFRRAGFETWGSLDFYQIYTDLSVSQCRIFFQ